MVALETWRAFKARHSERSRRIPLRYL